MKRKNKIILKYDLVPSTHFKDYNKLVSVMGVFEYKPEIDTYILFEEEQ